MNTKTIMISTLAVSVATFAATVAFGIMNQKRKCVAVERDFIEREEELSDDEN